MNPITFPGLGLEFHINRVAFSVFGKPIYWYGIIIAVGFVLAVTYCYYNAARYGIQKDRVIDLVPGVVDKVGSILNKKKEDGDEETEEA